MVDHLRNFTQGRFDLITGSAQSGKSNKLITLVNTFTMGKKESDNNLLVVKHPYDDKGTRHKISSFKKESVDAIECETADKLADMINENTTHIVISGIHLFDKNIIDLCDELVMSNRIIIASGINLTYEGKPYGSMAELMAIADNYELMVARCGFCDRYNAFRTQKITKDSKETFEPRCLVHYEFEGRPDYNPYLTNQEPSLEAIIGPMFSGKTDLLHTRYSQIINKERVAIFKWIKDSRYSADKVVSHNKDDIPSKNITKTNDIKTHLEKNKQINLVMIDEIQFIPGSYKLVKELLYKGYRVILTGLKRDFRKKPFGYPDSEISKILTLATEITNMYASCYICGHPATETQRVITENGIVRPAGFNDPIVLVGGEESYKAACRTHHEIKDAPANNYSNKFNKLKI